MTPPRSPAPISRSTAAGPRRREGLAAATSAVVMPGLVPGIHALQNRCKKDVDGRDKPGHDESVLPALPERQHVQAEPPPHDPEQQHGFERERDRGRRRGAVAAEPWYQD